MQEERLAAQLRHGQEHFDIERPRQEDVMIPEAQAVDYDVLRMDVSAQAAVSFVVSFRSVPQHHLTCLSFAGWWIGVPHATRVRYSCI
jgi:hypothetical protein